MGIETKAEGNVTTTTVTAPIQTPLASGAEETVAMNFSDIRRAINGEMDFTVKINNDVEISLKELEQTELNNIENEIDRRGISQYKKFTPEEVKKIEAGEMSADYISNKDYTNTLKVLKLAWAYKGMTMKGKKIQLKDEDNNVVTGTDRIRIYFEKLLLVFGEAVINGLFMQYENFMVKKFLDVQKKIS